MAKCMYCGKEFDVDVAADDFNMWADQNYVDADYDDCCEDGYICDECAIVQIMSDHEMGIMSPWEHPEDECYDDDF